MNNMEISIEEKKENASESIIEDRNNYPYGLKLHIDDDTFKKLNMTGAPTVGQKFMVMAQAEVSDVHQDKKGSGIEISFSLQITDMELKAAETEEKKEIADSLYSGS